MKDYIVTKVHYFRVGDAEDPDIYAAQPLWEFQQSEKGRWIMENSIEPPTWHRHVDYNTFGYTYVITAKLPKEKYTFFKLKYD
jgi:hypothetical protein